MPSAAEGGRSGLSIGQVLQALKSEFPEISISKLRFLEAEGLIAPHRSPSGYRKFSPTDVDRIRYILTAQRDHYYPLRVIREHLDALARGLEPPAVAGGLPRVAMPAEDPLRTDPAVARRTGDGAASAASGTANHRPPLRISRAELLANSALDDLELDQLISFGLIAPQPGSDYFGGHALTVATTVAKLSAHGLEPRHLRAVKTSADREIGLIEHVVSPLRRQRGADAATRLNDAVSELAELCLTLHAALLRAAVTPES
jgi:DNA-binding transcriptional MerR regulator